MAIDIQKLTLGEVAKIEELSGQSIVTIGEDDSPKGLTLAALAFVAKRREDPSFKWNDALNLTFDQANEQLGLTEEGSGPLDEAPAEPPASPESSSAKSPKPAARKK